MLDEEIKRKNLYDVDCNTVKSMLRAIRLTEARRDKLPTVVYEERIATIRSRLWNAIRRIVAYQLDQAREVSPQ